MLGDVWENEEEALEKLVWRVNRLIRLSELGASETTIKHEILLIYDALNRIEQLRFGQSIYEISLRRPYMRTIAVGNQKGGVGKTTTTLNLGYALASLGRTVLLVDLDPQGSLTIASGVDDRPGRSMAEVLAGDMRLDEILVEINENLSLAPSDIGLSETELILVGKIGREVAVSKALARLGNRVNYVLLDLPPSLGILTVSGLAAAHSVLIPAIPQYLELRALAIFIKTIDLVKEEINPDLEIVGILPTFYDSRLKLHGEVLEAWNAAGLPVLPMQVKRSIRVAEAPISGGSIVGYSPEHGEVYKQLAEMIDDG